MRRWRLVGLIVGSLASAGVLVERCVAEVPRPSLIHTYNPEAPDAGITLLSPTYDSPTLINYGFQCYDLDSEINNPSARTYDLWWSEPVEDIGVSPNGAEQRTVTAETNNYTKSGNMLWRMTGGMYPINNDTDQLLTDAWILRQDRLDQATDGPIKRQAAFVVKAQAGRINVVVELPDGTAASGAQVLIDGTVMGETNVTGSILFGSMPPTDYQLQARLGPMSAGPVTATVMKGQTVSKVLKLVSGM